MPVLSSLKQCTQVLRLRAIAELEKSQNEKVLEDIKLILYLANSLHDEPLVTSQLVRVSIIDFALQPLWEGLADRKWSDAELVVIEQALAKFDILSDYRFAVRDECARDIDLVDEYEQQSRSFHKAWAELFLIGIF